MCSPDWLAHGSMAADKRGLEENHPNVIKDKRGMPTASITLKSERLGERPGCQSLLKALARATRQEKQTEVVNGKTQRPHGMARSQCGKPYKEFTKDSQRTSLTAWRIVYEGLGMRLDLVKGLIKFASGIGW